MPVTLSQVVEIVKLPVKTMLVLAVCLGALLVTDRETLDHFGLGGFVEDYKAFLAIAFLFFSIAVIVELGSKTVAFAKPWLIQWWIVERQGKRYLKTLTPEEKRLLHEAINEDTRIVRIHVTDGNAKHLVHYKVITQASNATYGHDQHYEYCINPWAWEFLHGNKGLLNER